MAQLIVTVERLNKRSAVPSNFADKSSVIGVVNKGFRFEGTEVTEIANAAPGKWYQDRDGSFYWGGGLMEVTATGPGAVPGPGTGGAAPAAGPAAPVAGPLPGVGGSAGPIGGAIAALTLDGKKAFQWFMDLGVHAIWNDPNGTKGEGVRIAVLDTGYRISNKDVLPAVVGVAVIGADPAIQASDFTSPLIDDQLGHGNFSSSIVAARNSLEAVVGIAPASELLIGKISEMGELPVSGLDKILLGIEWAVANGAEVISVSFGKYANELPQDPGYLDGVQQKLDGILAGKNVLVFAACGDNRPGIIQTKEIYPASLKGCVSVGSTDQGHLSAVTVLSGRTLMHAQGVDVECYFDKDTPTKQSGTSVSTPIVAGVAALAISRLKKKDPEGKWDAGALLQLMYDTGDPVADAPVHQGAPVRKLINPAKLFLQL